MHTSSMSSLMSDESTVEFRKRYLCCRETYGLLSTYVTELRQLVMRASRQEWLTQQQRDELLALIAQIDTEREEVGVSAI